MRRLAFTAATAIGAMLLTTAPANALPREDVLADVDGLNAVEAVLQTSGAEGFDRVGNDYDILREALLATGLADAVATTDGITVFAPNDRAFKHLAEDLGWDGSDGEAGALGFIAAGVGLDTVADVLTYHVGTSVITEDDLAAGGSVATLLGPELGLTAHRVIDADPTKYDAAIRTPRVVSVTNGTIVTIDSVLRPLDLPDGD